MVQDLNILIQTMKPRLNEGIFVYVFCNQPQDFKTAIFTFCEREGMTYVISEEEANSLRINYTSTWAWITLDVHSDLNAVGFTAFFSKVLCEVGVSCNIIAAYHHDQIFVPFEKRHIAMDALLAASQIS
jgi:hypothetical protein